MPTSHALDAYLETIYILASEGITVIGARVADMMAVRAPSVTEAVQRLENRDLVTVDNRHVIALTPAGWERAESLIRRHRIAERWLTEVIGLDWAQADVEAHKLEHSFSTEVADRLSQMMEHPKTCPHGNPIPGNWDNPTYFGLLLSEVAPGDEVIVERILEHAEVDFRLLRYLWNHGILPDTRLTIIETVPGAGTITVRRGDHEVALGLSAASKIQVRPAHEE